MQARLVFIVTATVLGCSAGPASKAPVAAEEAPVAQAPTVAAPELIKMETPDAPIDCAAQGPDGGLLDRSSPAYRRIEYAEDGQSISEKAWLTDADVLVVASIGGCAHYGASYVIETTSSNAVEDRAHHIAAALDLADALPKRPGAVDYLDDIRAAIEGAQASPAGLADCHFPRGEMVNISCHVSSPEGGRISVLLSYDIVL